MLTLGMWMIIFYVYLFKNIYSRVVPCMLCQNMNNDQSLSVNSALENTMNSFCQECRARRSVTGLQKLIHSNG